jgi:transposase
MLHAGLDLSRKRLDYCLLDEHGDRVEVGAAPPDGDGLAGLARRVAHVHGAVEVRAAIESMTGARFVHDALERCGWDVQVADAVKVKGLAPLACKTDRIDAWVLAELSRRDLVPAIWLPDFAQRQERERARWRLHLVKHRSALKHRVHSMLMTFGHTCPVSDLFGTAGRELLTRLDLPEPWRSDVLAAVALIDDLDRQIDELARELKALGAEHPYVSLLQTVPGVAWVLGYTIAAEIGDITRFSSPAKLVGYTGLCPRVRQRRHGPPRPAGQTRPEVPALGADRSRHPWLPAPRLPRALPAHQGPSGPPARREGRADRTGPPARRSDLAHAHPQPALCSQRRRAPSGRLTALFEMRHRSTPPSDLIIPTRTR